MIILLSPTKKQIRHPQISEHALFFEETKNEILRHLQTLSQTDIQKAYNISDALTQKTHHNINHYQENSPALFTYSGEAFKSLDPKTLSQEALTFSQDHLLIFSALYGLLKPCHNISEYRLDLLTKLSISLTSLWKPLITDHLNKEKQPLINLASQEFFNLIDLDSISVPIYHVKFVNDKNKVISARSKKARGLFARALLESQTFDLEHVKIESHRFSHIEDNNTYVYVEKAPEL